MSRIYAVFDPGHIGASLQLSNSDMVVTTTAPSLDVHRMVRTDIPLDVFNGNGEWLVYGSGSIANLAYVGVVKSGAPTNKYVGEDANGVGYKLSDGHLVSNAANVASWATSAKDDIIAMFYNATALTLTFYRGNSSGFVLLGVYTLPDAGPWYPAATIGSTAAGDLSVFWNGGSQGFEYPQPGGDGWWESDTQINPVRVASEDFIALPTDAVPSAVYDGAVSPDNPASLAIVRGVLPWPWRSSANSLAGGQSYGSITISDPNDEFQALITNDTRDLPAAISRTLAQEFGGSVDSAAALVTGVLDRVDTAGDFAKTIYIKDALAQFDGPVQRKLFLPNVDASAVGRPQPIVAGCGRSIPGILIQGQAGTPTATVPFVYVFADMPITQLAVRMAGKLLVVGVDFVMTANARGIVLDATLYPAGATGKLTADVSTVGGSTVGLTDLLTTMRASYSGTAAGTNTYTSSAPAPSTGSIYQITFTNANTGASTLDGHPIKIDGAAVTSGQIPAGGVLFLRYDGTNYAIVGSSLGWQFNSYSSAADLTRNTTIGGYGANVPAWVGSGTDPTYPYPRLEMGPQGGSGIGTWAASKFNILRAGYSYIVKVDIEHIPAQAIHAAMPAYLFASLIKSFSVTDGQASVFNKYYVDYGTDSFGSPTIQWTITNTSGADAVFNLGFTANNVSGTHGVGLAKIKRVYLYELPLATSVVNLTGMGLEDYCRLIIETEGGLPSSVWNSADAAAIDAATGYKSIGNYIAEPTTIRNALQPVLDSYCADLFVDRNGVIRIFRLVDPATLTTTGQMDERVILGPVQTGALETGVTLGSSQASMIAMSQDHAPGLTTKFGARPNRSKYTNGDFGPTSMADCSASTRALLTQDFQAVVASGAQLSRAYALASRAQTLATCFDDPAEAQIEGDRVCAMFTQLRYFYAVPLKSDATDAYEIGQGWQLIYPRYDLDAGVNVAIAGITELPITEQLTSTTWG